MKKKVLKKVKSKKLILNNFKQDKKSIWKMGLMEIILFPIKFLWLIFIKTPAYRMLKIWFKIVYKFIGQAFIFLGKAILHNKNKYLLLTSIIENVFQTNEIYVRVTSVRKFPLYVQFSVYIISASETVNWDYFKQELALQLGCENSDIAVVYEKDRKTYTIDLTNTALNNFQKGTMPYEPDILTFETMDEKVLN